MAATMSGRPPIHCQVLADFIDVADRSGPRAETRGG